MHCWFGMAALLVVPAAVRAQVGFTDVTSEASLMYDHVTKPETVPCADTSDGCEGFLLTAGATVGDFNDDGCVDLFVTRYDATDLLFENQCDGSFAEVASEVGLTADVQSNGALFVDIDSDGDLDLYVVTQATDAHLLYINDGAHLGGSAIRPSFSEEALTRGAAIEPDPTRRRQGMSVAAGDFDRDGYVDLFTTEWNGQPPVTCGETHARLLHNRGAAAPGFFDDVTDAARTLMTFGNAGTTQVPLSFSPAFPDLDDDGWPELAVASDGRTSQLFWNDANGRFTRGTEAAMVGTDEFGMGSTFGDYDNDGDFDWFVTSIYEVDGNPRRDGNRLYRNEGGRLFSDQTDAAGVRDGAWGWGAAFFDYDNDGDLDLGHTNGFPVGDDYLDDPLRLWRNDEGVMTEVAQALGMTDTGDGRAYLTFDYDNDGDLDVFLTNHHGTPVLYRNDGGNAGDWLRVRARGLVSPADGRGAKITATAEDLTQVRQIGVGSHFLGEGETVAHFGLGPGYGVAGGTVDLHVRFPSGRIVEMSGLAPNQLVEVVEPMDGVAPFEPCLASVVDCDDNGVIDTCDIAADGSLDSDGDGAIDDCGVPEAPAACVRQGTDTGTPDGGVVDPGTPDGGVVDSGVDDAGMAAPPMSPGTSGCSIRAIGPSADLTGSGSPLTLFVLFLVYRCNYRRKSLTRS